MWIEAITVRTAKPEQCEGLLEELTALRKKIGISRPEWVACYQSLEVENEFSVHLAWNEEIKAPARTDCGLLIARRFEQLGLVHHTLWIRSLYSS